MRAKLNWSYLFGVVALALTSDRITCYTETKFRFISLSYKTKDYCIQLAKAEGEQIGRKASPSFLPFGEILGSYRGT